MPPKKRAASTATKRKAPAAKAGLSIYLFTYLMIKSGSIFSSENKTNKETSRRRRRRRRRRRSRRRGRTIKSRSLFWF
jgi:hypothetical protein